MRHNDKHVELVSSFAETDFANIHSGNEVEDAER